MIKSEKLNRTYTTQIGESIRLEYSVARENNEPAKAIYAIVFAKDRRIGTASFERRGAVGITLGGGLTSAEKESILLDMIHSSEEIFQES